MASHDGTHTELARTVDDLAQWLSVVEVGLIGMLDSGIEAAIEEEHDDPILVEGDSDDGGTGNGDWAPSEKSAGPFNERSKRTLALVSNI